MSRQSRFGSRLGTRSVVIGLLLACGSVGGGLVLSSRTCHAAAPAADGSNLAGAMAGKPYTLSIAKVSAKKGQPATTLVVFKPGPGYHLNKDFPTSLKLTPPGGVTLAKAELKKADAKLSETEGSFEVTLTADKPGAQQVSGELRFAVCTETTCDPQRSPVAIELDVK